MTPDDWGLTLNEARDLIRAQICPVCGEGPWKIPLGHVSRAHGIDAFTMRDMCGLTVAESVTDEDTHRRLAAEAADMAAVTEASRSRGKQRWTTAGRANAAAPLVRWAQENPDEAATQRAEARSRGSASASSRGSQRIRWGLIDDR